MDPTFVPRKRSVRRNERASHFEIRLRHASPLTGQVMRRLPERERGWSRWTIKVSDSERQLLAAEYETEVARLEQQLGRSLPWSMG